MLQQPAAVAEAATQTATLKQIHIPDDCVDGHGDVDVCPECSKAEFQVSRRQCLGVAQLQGVPPDGAADYCDYDDADDADDCFLKDAAALAPAADDGGEYDDAADAGGGCDFCVAFVLLLVADDKSEVEAPPDDDVGGGGDQILYVD